MKKEPKFIYKDGTTICEVTDNMGRIFRGESNCHPDDKDFESPITGGVIAEFRAQIAVAKTYRDDLKIKLSALRQLYSCIKQSNNFNRNSYETKMLLRQISLTTQDLDIAKHQLAVLKLDLYNYISDKDKIHQYLRKYNAEKLDKNKKNL